jgi:hypothetical protein
VYQRVKPSGQMNGNVKGREEGGTDVESTFFTELRAGVTHPLPSAVDVVEEGRVFLD